jgi:hypothetical protein
MRHPVDVLCSVTITPDDQATIAAFNVTCQQLIKMIMVITASTCTRSAQHVSARATHCVQAPPPATPSSQLQPWCRHLLQLQVYLPGCPLQGLLPLPSGAASMQVLTAAALVLLGHQQLLLLLLIDPLFLLRRGCAEMCARAITEQVLAVAGDVCGAQDLAGRGSPAGKPQASVAEVNHSSSNQGSGGRDQTRAVTTAYSSLLQVLMKSCGSKQLQRSIMAG